jgi:hypothetical protein
MIFEIVALLFKLHFRGEDCEKFSLHLDFLVLRIMHCINTKWEWSIISATVRRSTAVVVPLYKNLRVTKFLDFMVLKDSVTAHTCIKMRKLPKDLRVLRYISRLCLFIRRERSCLSSKFTRYALSLLEMR